VIAFPLVCHTLDNGLRVVLQEDRSTPLVAVHLMYHVGSRNERRGRTGFAHLFEHLLFQGSEHVGDDEHFKYIQDAGGTLNGTTWFDRTNYFETLPSNQLDLALWLESDRMGFFLPAITQTKLDNQRDVVKNERRQSYENRPYGLALETVLRNAYPEGHPYRHPTIGYMEDLERASLDDVRDFFCTFYTPNNAVLVLSGDFESSAVLARVERYFGEIPAAPPPPSIDVPDVPAPGERRETIEDRVSVPRVYLMFRSPAFPHPDFETADVISSLLADGNSSRLHRELVYEQQIAADAHAFIWPTESVGMLFAVATARPGVSADRLEAAMLETLARLRAEGVRREELDGARNRARHDLVGQLSSLGERADFLAHAAVLRGDPEYVNEAFGRYAAVDADAIGRVLAEVLRPEGRTVVRVVPRAGAQ